MMFSKEPDIPAWSWIISVIGFVIVVAAVGYMFLQTSKKDETPPDIIVKHKRIVKRTNAYLVEIAILNKGGTPASRLVVEGNILQDDKAVETSVITIEYAPAGSERKAGLLFTRDPRLYQFRLRATGYEEP